MIQPFQELLKGNETAYTKQKWWLVTCNRLRLETTQNWWFVTCNRLRLETTPSKEVIAFDPYNIIMLFFAMEYSQQEKEMNEW